MMLTPFSAMAQEGTEAEGLKDGTYSVTQGGFDGDFTVDVTIAQGKISDVKVVKTLDSLGIGEMAQKELAKTIIEKQSTNIDTVSGATISSKTFLSAVKNALKEAGAGDDMFAEDCTTVRYTQKGDIESFKPDVIVVGAGLAGVVSAMTAVENGAKVLVIEQEDYVGGTSLYAGGAVAESGSPQQPQDADVEINADTFYSWLEETNKDYGDFSPELARKMADTSGEAYDQLVEWGMKPAGLAQFFDSPIYYTWQDSGDYTSTGWFLFNSIAPTLDKMVEDGNLIFKMNTKATGFVQGDNGVVTGVTTEDGDTFNAKAVILSTGGFTNCEELMDKIYSRYGSYGAGSATGEMQLAAMDLGAKTYAMDMTRWEPGMVNVTGENNAQVQYEVQVANPGYVWVDKAGKRVGAGDSKDAKPWKDAEDNTVYVLLTEEMLDEAPVLKLGNASNCQLDEGNVAFNKLLSEEKCVYSGDTIEEVAQKAGVDPEGLAATVEQYNGYCESGEDPDFQRDPANLIKLNGPFYLIETIGGVKGTSGGLVIDTEGRVLAEDDKPIEGLYASGEACGTLAFNGNCVYYGGCYIICNTYGRIAGQEATAYALK